MATPVRLPRMGITMEEGIISKWLVSEGDTVSAGQPLVEFETEKINAPVESPAAGIVGGIRVREGDVLEVLGVIAYILAPGEKPPAQDEPAPEAAQGPAAPVATPLAGLKAESVAAVGGSPPVPRAPAPAAVSSAPPVRSDGRIKASPLARRIAGEAGVDIAQLVGSGPGGRVVAADVRAIAQRAVAAPPPGAPVAGETLPLTSIRRAIGEKMMQSLAGMAQLTLVTEADATELVDLRTKLAAQHEKELGYRIAYNDLIARIAIRALVEQPHMNATLHGNEIVRLPHVNIGLAVDLERGLMVPNVKSAEAMQLVELSKTLRALIERTRAGKLTLDDISGGTFTITSLGPMEVDAFTPVINPPECAILGVGRIVEKPVALNGEVVIRQRVTLSLTFDHRVNDGAPAGRFLQRIKQLMEQPYLLI